MATCKDFVEIPVPHGDLIDRDDLIERLNLFKEEIGPSAYGLIREIIMGTGVIVERRGR